MEKFEISEEVKLEANFVFLCDRIDIAVGACNGDIQLAIDTITKHSDAMFNPLLVDAFLKAESSCSLIANLLNGQYYNIMIEVANNAVFDMPTKINFLSMLTFSIDFRSPTMVLHTITTTFVSRTVGELMGIRGEDLDILSLGALLHDIGKINTPVEILEKNGKLDDAEMAIMQKHVEVTYLILHGTVDDVITNIACRHHEKSDGSGYPNKLTEKDLTLSEQIVAVSDILSALIRKRSYKSEFSKEQTVGILSQMRDNHKLNANVTDIIIENYDEIIEKSDLNSKKLIDVYNNISQEYYDIQEYVKNL